MVVEPREVVSLLFAISSRLVDERRAIVDVQRGDADLGANAAGAGDFLSALAGLFDFSTYWWFWLLLLLLLLWWFFIWRRRSSVAAG